MFVFGSTAIIVALRNGTYKKSTQTLLIRGVYGFVKGFVLSFIIISIFVASLVYGKGYNEGTFFDFVLWNTFISFFVALMNSMVMAVGVDIHDNTGIYSNFYLRKIRALGIVGTIFSGFVTFTFIIMYLVRLQL